MNKTKFIATAFTVVLAIMSSNPCHAGDAPKKAPNTEKKFEKLDADKNGSLSLEEFKARAKDPAKAEKKFTKLDSDKNGSLSLSEFSARPPKKPKPTQP